MLHSIQTGESGYVHIHGKPLWEEMAESPSLTAAFDTEMEQHARSVGAGLLVKYSWDHARTVIDVGGGTGALLRVLLTEHRHLRGTVVEMADAASRARSLLSEAGLSNRSDVFEGSFFEPLPKAADTYLLSWILHDWADREAIQILERCQEAIERDGRILIIEKPLDRYPDTALDLRMLVFFGGKERFLFEYEKLINAAGLLLIETIDLNNGFSALVCGAAKTV
jgi:nucleotide-binding universal stress UspA family protein